MAAKNEIDADKMNARIARAIKLRAELDEVRQEIFDDLKRCRLKEYRAPNKAKVQRVQKTSYSFDVEKLKVALTPQQFTTLCPPAADTSALRTLIETDPKMKRLAKCATVKKEDYVVIYANGN